MQKRYKHVHTDSYFYPAIQLAKRMMIFNIRVGPVRTQMTNSQKMNTYEMIIQMISNLHIYSSDESESKKINGDKNLSHVCYKYESESKRLIVIAYFNSLVFILI